MWERYNVSAQQALSQGKLAEAENFFRMALAEAKKLPPNDPKIPTTINNLANCLRQQSRYADAEPLYKEAISIKEKAAGHNSKDLAVLLENYAKMLRLAGRTPEAEKLDARVHAIYAKH
jgi:tetratricopeptide (TPR) repeat protein